MTFLIAAFLATQDIDRWIEDLGSPRIDVRELAQAELIRQGEAALAALERALLDPDPEVAGRAEEVLIELRGGRRAMELRRSLSRELQAEAPEVIPALLSDDPEQWLEILEGLSGWRVGSDGMILERGTRQKWGLTRRDLVSLLLEYRRQFVSEERIEWCLLGLLSIAFDRIPAELEAQLSEDQKRNFHILRFWSHSAEPIRGCGGLRIPPIWGLLDTQWDETARDALSSDRERIVPAARRLLEHPDGPVRGQALELLLHHDPEHCEKDFLRLLSASPGVEEIASACLAVERLHFASLEPGLRRAGFARWERSRIVEALADLGCPASEDLFVAALRDDSPASRKWAAFGLGRIRAHARADSVANLLEDRDVEVRRLAVRAMGFLGSSRHIPRLRAALREIRLRNEAMIALGRLGDGRVRPLASFRTDDIDEVTRQAADLALLCLRNPAGPEPLPPGTFRRGAASLACERGKGGSAAPPPGR